MLIRTNEGLFLLRKEGDLGWQHQDDGSNPTQFMAEKVYRMEAIMEEGLIRPKLLEWNPMQKSTMWTKSQSKTLLCQG